MEVLRVNKRLPKIILPKEKAKLFLDWYKKDLCNEDNIPEVFSEGYFYVDVSDFIKIITLNIFELDSKKLELQKQLIETIHKRYDSAIIYFKFLRANTLKLLSYSQKTKEFIGKADELEYETVKMQRAIQTMKNIILKDSVKFSNVDEDLIIDIPNLSREIAKDVENREVVNFNNILNEFNLNWANTCFYLLVSALWYLASIKNKKEDSELRIASYVNNTTVNNRNNNNKKHYDYVKNITTPIYDLNKTKLLNIDKLIAKKKGWKISCEFSVRGHYRHYKSGKVVFIKSFEKGKGLEARQNVIKLNPDIKKRG